MASRPQDRAASASAPSWHEVVQRYEAGSGEHAVDGGTAFSDHFVGHRQGMAACQGDAGRILLAFA